MMITAAASAFRRTIADGLAGLPRELGAGFVAALSALTNCFALGALIFSGPLHPFLSQGIAASLLTCGVTAFIIALTSHFRIAIASPTAAISALLAVLMASLAPAMNGLPPEQILALAYAALFTNTAATKSGTINSRKPPRMERKRCVGSGTISPSEMTRRHVGQRQAGRRAPLHRATACALAPCTR